MYPYKLNRNSAVNEIYVLMPDTEKPANLIKTAIRLEHGKFTSLRTTTNYGNKIYDIFPGNNCLECKTTIALSSGTIIPLEFCFTNQT